jgi:hypothetical protein
MWTDIRFRFFIRWCLGDIRVGAGSSAFLGVRRTGNGNGIYRRSGRLALARLAGVNQADGGTRTKPPCPRPARSNSAGRGARSESFVHTSAGLAIGREPTACRAQMAKAGRRGSCLLRPVRGIALTDSVPTRDQHTTPRRLPTIADSGWRLARSSPGRAIPPVRSVSPPHPACIPTSFSSILPCAGSGVSLFRPAS